MIPAILRGPGVKSMLSDSGLEFNVITAKGLVFSCWTPSPEEMAMLNRGIPVWLVQRGPFIPEMSMRVGEQSEVIPHDLRVASMNESLRDEQEHKRTKRVEQARFEMRLIAWFLILSTVALCLYTGWRLL